MRRLTLSGKARPVTAATLRAVGDVHYCLLACRVC